MHTLTKFLITAMSVLCIGWASYSASSPAGNTNQINPDTMLLHNVYFYLNDDVSESQKKEFEQGIKQLLEIPEIDAADWGTPANTPSRDVTDHAFAYSISVRFTSMDDYEVYADHPDHLEFIDSYQHLWDEVKVYDSNVHTSHN